MRSSIVVALSVLALSLACSDTTDSPVEGGPDAGASEAASPLDSGGGDSAAPGADAAAEAAPSYVEPASCALREDASGPGQYSDTCVKRAWVADYAGAYSSAKCELSITIDGAVAAAFTMKVLDGALAGTYTAAWDGAPSPGNDSYFRFTTDATYATTKTLNFAAGEKVGTSDERSITLRVEEIDTGAPVYKGRYSQVLGGKNEDFNCETLTRK